MIVALLAASTWREWAFAAMVLLLLMALMLVARHIEHLALKAQDQRRDEEAAAVAAERRRRFLPKRGYTEQEMRLFNGADRDLPIALACAGKVFNVSLGREFYGSSGCYHCLAGRDASRLLAKGILVEESPDEALEPLSPDELESMRQWLELYEHKYEYLGPLLRDDGTAADDSGGATNLVVDSTGIRWRLVGGAEHVNHENESHRESDKMN